MTKKEFLKLYKGKAVWCKTEELANEFLELADGFGLKWTSGDKLTEYNNYNEYEKETCYFVRSFVRSFIMFYGIKKWSISNGYEIVEFNSLKSNSTAQVTFDPPKTILTLNGKEFVSVAKDKPFDKEKGVLMCLAKANGFDYEKVSELVASAKKQTPKLTEAERVILENLPKEYKWIVRNGDREETLHLFKERPNKSRFFWDFNENYWSFYEFKHLFQFIKWSDDEPYEISKLLE